MSLEELPSFGDPEREARVDAAFAAYDDARRDMAELDRVRARAEARHDVAATGSLHAAYVPPRRVPIEVETVAVQASSISIEDMATGAKVKVTTKLYAGSPLTSADMDAALEAHAYLHREAKKRAMDGWLETAEQFGRAGE